MTDATKTLFPKKSRSGFKCRRRMTHAEIIKLSEAFRDYADHIRATKWKNYDQLSDFLRKATGSAEGFADTTLKQVAEATGVTFTTLGIASTASRPKAELRRRVESLEATVAALSDAVAALQAQNTRLLARLDHTEDYLTSQNGFTPQPVP